MTNNFLQFIKNEIVFVIATFLVLISAFFVKPSTDYINYIDFRTLALLFALMLVVQGLRSCGLFDVLVEKLIDKVKNTRQLTLMLVMLCFFTSMLITNDVALITFVPFSIILLGIIENSSYSIYLIVLETIAANLGSMFTPIGNPQNLYLFSISGISITDFLLLMFPYTALSLLLLIVATLLIKPTSIKADSITTSSSDTQTDSTIKLPSLIIYFVLFALCIMSVLHILDYRIMLGIVIIVVFFTDKNLLPKADYILLLTFIAFFVFIGNIKNIPEINSMLASLVNGRECLVAILASQIVSNVPAAMLLSGFTKEYSQLIIGTNLGGLGTLIASMASLISFKFYVKTNKSKPGKYIAVFSSINIIFLIVLFLFLLIFNN